MGNRVCIIGIGVVETSHAFTELSHKELLFRATRHALDDAGLERKDVGGAITATYDFLEGRSLSNQYTLDSIGGVMKPCDLRLAEDGIYSLFAGYMEVMADPYQIVVVASVQKASEIDMEQMSYQKVILANMEPILARPVCQAIPNLADLESVLAALDARPFLSRTGLTEKHLERVMLKNLKNSRPNTNQKSDSYKDVLESEMRSWPIRDRMRSIPTDAACSLILCSEKRAKKICQTPVFIKGIGWSSDKGHPANREQGVARETLWAARHAYDMAGIKRPNMEFDVAEISDWFPHRELMHCEALGFCKDDEIATCVLDGVFEKDGKLPVNVSGGLLGKGNAIGTSGLIRVAQVGLQIRGQSYGHQIPRAELGLAHSWGGLPLATAGVAVLSKW